MLNKIKEMRDRGERVALRCIDSDSFKSTCDVNKKILYLKEIEVCHYQEKGEEAQEGVQLTVEWGDLEALDLEIGDAFILSNELSFFEIVSCEKTFNDLVDVAIQAYKDGLIVIKGIDEKLNYEIKGRAGSGGNVPRGAFNAEFNVFEHHINSIKSLYTETFVIEGDSDIERLRDGAKITLTNNEKGVFNIISGLRSITNTETGAEIMGLNTFWLKGATVTQKRGK